MAMNLLPKTTKDFGKTHYWDSFFKKRGKKAFEWYGEYPELCGLLHKYIKPFDKVLVIGCGNSKLSSDMYDVGYRQIMNIDISNVVIKQMQRHAKSGLEYLQMDALNMTFKDSEFSVVLDKGTLDALMPDNSKETIQRVNQMFHEVERVLRIGGRYICVSLLQEHILHHITEYFSSCGWMIRICRCSEVEDRSVQVGSSGLAVFAVVCTKFKKMRDVKPVFEVCLSGDTVQRMASLKETMDAVKSAQQVALICSGLNRCNISGTGEVSLELTRPGDKYPRYTVFVADKPNIRNPSDMSFAAFIVPQGREREWLFGTPEGRTMLVESSNFDRLAIIHLHRQHKYDSLKDTQDETAETIVRLAPKRKDSEPRPKIPFLSVAADLGHRREVAKGESKISGAFIVEEAEGEHKHLYRRLVFLANQNVVQSEAKMKTVTNRGRSENVVDFSYLACDHHIYMSMGIFMLTSESESNDEHQVLVIGLGGGGLCMYIKNLFEKVVVTAVDIDPAVYQIAKDHFSLTEDNKLKVVIADGLEYLRGTSEKGPKYGTILFDVDSKDSSTGLSCPPASFLDPEILSAVANSLEDSGLFILNFVCRVVEIRKQTWNKLKKLFKTVISVKLEQEVNEILFCWKGKPTMSLKEASEKFNHFVKEKNPESDELIDMLSLDSMIRTA